MIRGGPHPDKRSAAIGCPTQPLRLHVGEPGVASAAAIALPDVLSDRIIAYERIGKIRLH